MELLLSVYYNVDDLAGKPREYDPSVAVWTTDPEQAQTVAPGRAVDYIPMDAGGHTTRSVSFNNKTGLFPINDLRSDLCIALYAKSQSDGATPDAGKNRPFTIAVGQVNVPWSVIVRFLISNGNAYFSRNPNDENLKNKRSFPMATVSQEVSSLVVAEGVAYEIQMRQMANDNTSVTTELKRLGPDALSKKGALKISATLLATSDKVMAMTLRERLDLVEQYYVASAPGFRGHTNEEKFQKRLKLGHIHASDMVKASQNYDKLTDHEERAFTDSMKRYRQFYDSLWYAAGGHSGKKLIVFDKTGEKTVLFKPDVPSITRFHLPLWVNGNDLIPYAEWWLHTLPEHISHMPKPTIFTEQLLGTLAVMAFKRIDIEPKKFIKVIGQLSDRAGSVKPGKFPRFLIVGSKERNNFIKCIELVFYAVMMVSHAIRYSGDGRYVKILKEYLRLDVECPQHDTVAGTADDADCEDMATVIALFCSLLLLGRQDGDSKTGGRGWGDPVLAAMRRVLQMYCDFNIFGSVRGKQLSDADNKEKGKEDDDDEGIIGSAEDVTEDIGGHSFVIQESLGEVVARYEKAAHLVDAITGFPVHERIKQHTMGVIRGWLGEQATPATSSTISALLYDIWKSGPSVALEGTGRAEPLLLSLEHYFGLGTEFLQRVARHASEIDVLERWPRENVVADPKKSQHHHQQSAKKDDVRSKAIQSMGEASPYMFQKRLTIRSMQDKNNSQRHVSAFYRRIVHSVSSRLHAIMPETFVHLIWVDSERLTYGPTLRSALEPGGSTLPIPLSPKLHLQYLSDTNNEVHDVEIIGNQTSFMSDLVGKRMRRIIPYDVSFQHLAPGIIGAPASETGRVASTANVWLDASDLAKKTKVMDSVPEIYTSSQSNHAHDAFYCKSEVDINGSRRVKGNVDSNTLYGKQAQQEKPSDEFLVLSVPSDSAVATAIRNVTSSTYTRALVLPNVPSCMVTRPMNGVITSTGASNLAVHVNSGAGIRSSTVYSERVMPWLTDNFCAHFTRDIKFVIEDNVKPTSPHSKAMKVTSRARSGNNIPTNLDEKHQETLDYMRFDIDQKH